MSDHILTTISDFAEGLLPSMGLELVEVQFRREQQGWVLRIFIDSEDGITLDHCSQVSRQLGDFLDVEDLIDYAYHLEVSSPGLERKLGKIEDFIRFCGKKTKIKLHQPIDGQKTFLGTIAKVVDDKIVLDIEGEENVEFTLDMISMARLAI